MTKLNKKILALTTILLFAISMVTCLDFSKAQVVNPVGIDSGLVGYWRLDSNSVIDSSGTNNNGILTGGNWVSGKYQSGLNFNGSTGNYIMVPYSSSLDFSVFTISFWINANISTPNSRFIVRGVNTGYDTALRIDCIAGGSSHIRCYVFSKTDSAFAFADSDFNAGQWTFITFSFNGTGITTYKNGVIFESVAFNHPITEDTASNLYLGVYGSALNYPINGTLDEIRIYNRNLSNSEVLTLYQGIPISVTHDLGSTVSPNGTVYVGVDQTQNFVLNSITGFMPWSYYIDELPYASASVINIDVQNTNRTLYVTSQFIGNQEPTEITNDFSFNINLILWLVFLVLDVILCIKRVPIVGFALAIINFVVLFFVLLPDTTFNIYWTFILGLVAVLTLALNALKYTGR